MAAAEDRGPLPPKPKEEPAPIAHNKHKGEEKQGGVSPAMILAALALVGIGIANPGNEFLAHFTVFVLAIFVGYMVVWNVAAALHTPLMSVTNAISGIIVIGGMLVVSGDPTHPATILGAIAILVATINIAGGFLVTQRMLKMFRK